MVGIGGPNNVKIKSKEVLDEVNRLWNKEGWSAKRIAQHYGVSESTIHRLSKELQDTGVKMADRRGTPAAATIKAMVAMRDKKASFYRISKHFGISFNTVRKHIIKFRPPGYRVPRDKVEEFLRKGPHKLNIYEANVAHLVDIKRAGHSPTRTELNIPRGVPDFLPIQHEFVGSSPAGLWNQI